MNVLTREDLFNAREYFEFACQASRAHSVLASYALEQYGDHGAQISGIVRDHFPLDVATRLRELARDVTRYSDMAWTARPKGVRWNTMRALSRAVAARDGSGFYGPQA